MLSSPPPSLAVCASSQLPFPYGFLFGFDEVPSPLTAGLTSVPILSCPNPSLVAQLVSISKFSLPWSFAPDIKLAFRLWVSPLHRRNNSLAFSPLRFSAFGQPVARCLASLPYGSARFGVCSARLPFSLCGFAFALPRLIFWTCLARTPASVFCPCGLALNSIPDYPGLLFPLKGFNPSLGSRCLYSDNLSVSTACAALKSFLSDFRFAFQRPLSFQES